MMRTKSVSTTLYAIKEVVNGIFDSVSHLLEPVRQELSFGEVA